MAAPIAPALPDIPSRSAPEADFDVKMFALFKWATDDFVSFMEAWRVYLETNSTVIGGALVLDELTGAAVQSDALDATEGRLLKVGGFGLGGYTAPTPGTDLDNLGDLGGIFYVDSIGVNKPDFAANFSVLSLPRHEALAAQLAFALNSNQNQRCRAAIRSKIGETTWADWAEIYTQYSILGTVSQSFGRPTGALIERGSNANGEFVRLADGTQICTHRINGDGLGGVDWIYPAAFSSAADAVLPAKIGPPGYVHLSGSGSSTLINVNIRNTSDAHVAEDAFLLAIGRWF